MNILQSASKLVFIGLAIASIGGFFTNRLSEANFMLLTGSAFTFYFAKKGDDPTAPLGGK